MTHIEFDMTPEFEAEMDRVLAATSLTSPVEAFRAAFTLLRIHVGAAQNGDAIILRRFGGGSPSTSPFSADERIILPFTVKANP